MDLEMSHDKDVKKLSKVLLDESSGIFKCYIMTINGVIDMAPQVMQSSFSVLTLSVAVILIGGLVDTYHSSQHNHDGVVAPPPPPPILHT